MSEKDKLIYNSATQILKTIIAKEGVSAIFTRKQGQIEDAIEYAEELYNKLFS